MNRQQRRDAAKKGVTADDLKYIYNSTKEQAIHHAVQSYSVATAMVLRDKWGFGEKRLQRYLLQVQEMFDAINEDYVSIEDCKTTLYNECGIDFK